MLDGSRAELYGANLSWNGRYGVNVLGGGIRTDSYNSKKSVIAWNGLDGIHVENFLDARGEPMYLPGADLGYFIWYDENGWNLVYSSDNETHVFNITITRDGTSTGLSDTLLGGEYAEKNLGDHEKIAFDLWIDGERNESLVFVGRNSSNPHRMPFVLREFGTGDNLIENCDISHSFASGIYVDGAGISIKDSEISKNGMAMKFFDDVESGADGWNAAGLWHRVYNGTKTNGVWNTPVWNISHSGNYSWWYGYEHNATGDYNTTDGGNSTSNYGGLTSPNISLDGENDAHLTFWSWHETEPPGLDHPEPPTIPPEPGPPHTESTKDEYDVRYVAVGTENDYNVYLIKNDPEREWTRIIINISEFAGKDIKVQFGFYTGDKYYNDYQGWYVDDIEVLEQYKGESLNIPRMQGCGIYMNHPKGLSLEHNTIYSNNWGIYGVEPMGLGVENSTINNNTQGIYLKYPNSCVLFNNTLLNNGVDMDERHTIIHTENTIKMEGASLYSGTDYSNDRVNLKLKENRAVSSVESDIRVKSVKQISDSGIYVMELDGNTSVEEAIEELSRNPAVEYVEPDYTANLYKVPNEAYNNKTKQNFSEKWGLRKIGAPEAWNITTGSRDIVVAVLDKPVNADHEDLKENIWNDSSIPTQRPLSIPDCDHGTHVAGIIGAVGNNSIGVVGVNWNVSIMPYSIFDNGALSISSAIEAIEYVINMKNEGVDVVAISASWGTSAFSKALYDEIAKARDNGILFVAAAGNARVDLDYLPEYPAGYNLTNIISVAATDKNDDLVDLPRSASSGWSSCYGKSTVDVAAPGVDILSTVGNNGYENCSGTSMATPFVSGLAALAASVNSSYDYINLKNIILNTVDHTPSLSDKILTGGRINASKAVSFEANATHLLVDSPGNGDRILKGSSVEVEISLSDGINPIMNASVCAETSSGEKITLHDDGVGSDQVAGDGYYSGIWKPERVGNITMKITADTGKEKVEKTEYLKVIGSTIVQKDTIRNGKIHVGDADGIMIKDNNIAGSGIGIHLEAARNSEIVNNTVTNTGTGIYMHLLMSYNITIDSNICENNTNGIGMYLIVVHQYVPFGMNISRNTCINNTESGIYVNVPNIDIYKNNLSLNKIGISVEGGSTLIKINKNNISSNNDGIDIASSHVEINNNNISDSERGIYAIGSSGSIGYESDETRSVSLWPDARIEIPVNANNITNCKYGIYQKNSNISVINNVITGTGENLFPVEGELNPSSIVLDSCNFDNYVHIEGNVGGNLVFIHVKNSKAELKENRFYLYGSVSAGYEKKYVGIEGRNSELNIISNELYGLYTGTEPQDYISAGIKLFDCSNSYIANNKIMPSYELGTAGNGVLIGMYFNDTGASMENNTIGGSTEKATNCGIMMVGNSNIDMSDIRMLNISRYGLYIEESTASIDKSDIKDIGDENNNGYAIASVNSHLEITNGTISDSNNMGIYASKSSSVTLRNQSLTRINSTEIYMENSTISILNNSNISETYGYGIYALNSTADIENSTFYHQMNWSVWLSASLGDVKIANNVIDNSTHGIYYGESDVEAKIFGNTISNHSYIEWRTHHLDSTPIYVGTPIGYGIYINNSVANISRENKFLHNAYAVYFHNSTGIADGNTFIKTLYNITILEIYRTCVPKGGEYVIIENSRNINIENNEFSDAYRAIASTNSRNIAVEDNTMEDVYVGASFKDTGSLGFKDNPCIRGISNVSTTGISLEGTDGYILFNDFENLTYGIRIGDMENMEIGHNTIENNKYGILIEGRFSSPSTIHHNEISRNTEGIHLSSTAYVDEGRIYDNNIEANTDYGAYNANSNYMVDMGYNWWGDPTGPAPSGSGNPVNEYIDASNPLSSPVDI